MLDVTYAPHPRPRTKLKWYGFAYVDGRTKQGRFVARTRASLIKQLGGEAVVTEGQRLLIQRIAVDMLRLETVDLKMADGTATDYDMKCSHAIRNHVRLALRDLGLVKRQKTAKQALAAIHSNYGTDDAA